MNDLDAGVVSPRQGDRMKAIVQQRYGGPDELQYVEIDRPTIGPDEVLVRVYASSICRGVWHMMYGQPYMIRLAGFGLRGPTITVPGMDVSGVVEAVGAKVTGFTPGNEVFGTAVGAGGFAEFAKLPQDKLALKPSRLSFAEAAVVPVSAMAALKAVRDVAKVRAGQRVLIVGASGGVGLFAVQLAKVYGATVTGVASTAKLDVVRAAGADEAIDYTQEDITRLGRRYDVVIDIGGNRSLRRLRLLLGRNGVLVIAGGGENSGKWIGGINRQLGALLWSPFISQTMTSFLSVENAEDLHELKRLIDAGQLMPVVDRTFPLAQTSEAMVYFEQGRVKGKIAITMV